MAQAEEKYITIGTGGQTGVYYVAGQSICRFINRDSKTSGVRCNAPASGGGVANVNGIPQRRVQLWRDAIRSPI